MSTLALAAHLSYTCKSIENSIDNTICLPATAQKKCQQYLELYWIVTFVVPPNMKYAHADLYQPNNTNIKKYVNTETMKIYLA